jgi:hypothetical protein
MHIEPGVVTGAKIVLSYATAAVSFGLIVKMAADTIRKDGGITSLALRSVITSALVFSFFELLPHVPVGVSEVHLVLGSTLLLILGGGPAAIGLALGLAIQGQFFEPADIPQYGMNVTTLIIPLFAMSFLAKRIIPMQTAYTELKYRQALSLSTAYQGGIVAWVAFWALYGHGFTAQNLSEIGTFGAAYMTVIIVEPLADLAVLAAAKAIKQLRGSVLVNYRLYQAGV